MESGRYGDLKLLAVSISLFIVCIAVALMIRNRNLDERVADKALNLPVAIEHQISVESSVAESGVGIGAPDYPSQRISSATVTPKDRKDAINDMADQIPKDQIIVF